jgi:hypothetical protein
MSTVFVFGAGASHHAGYPLAAVMGEPLLNWMLQSSDFAFYARYLVDGFGMPANIEEWITKIDSHHATLKGQRTSEERSEYRRLGTSIGRLKSGLAVWLRQFRDGSAPSYAEFSDRIVQPGDAVVTFNYDDALDCELRRTGKWDAFSYGYGFPIGVSEQACEVVLLKLHGSVNWQWNPLGGRSGDGSVFAWNGPSLGNCPVILPYDLKFLGYENPSGPGVYTGGAAINVVILPGLSKEFFTDTSFGRETTEFWDSLWSQATHALQSCSRVVVCGYSLPVADQRARDLLFKHPSRDAGIEIVCGRDSDRIAGEFEERGFLNVTPFGGGLFAEWLADQG